MRKKAHHLIHLHCDLDKAATYYMWGFVVGIGVWLLRWVVIFAIASHVITPGDGIVDIFEKAWDIVSDSDSILPAIAFVAFHTLTGVIKWLGLAYGVIGLAQRRKLINS